MKITTREELVNHIAHYKNQNKDIPLFEGYKFSDATQSFVRDVTIPAICDVSISNTITSYGESSPALMVGLQSLGSLYDRHIEKEQNYNDNWWFTTREEAEEHIRPKQFVVGKYYEWDIHKCTHRQKPHGQGGPLECVYVSPSQGVFRHRDGCLLVIALGHLKSGEFKLRQ